MKKMKMNALLSLACAATLAAGVGVFTLTNAPEPVNAETANTEAIFMADGASIRYSDPSGIRFIGYVDEDVYTANSVVGMKISVGGVEEIFSSQTETVNGAAWQWTKSDVEGYKKFQVAITNIPANEYTTELTAKAFVDSEESTAITRSIANVANAALAANELLDETDKNKLDDTKVSSLEKYTAGETALDPVSVKVLDNVASWTAVENAVGYLVKTDDDKPVKTTGTTYSVEGKSNVSVIAYGDGVDYTYSSVTEKTVHALGELELANFNDDSYITDLEAGNSSLPNYNCSGSAAWHTNTVSHKFYEYSTTAMTEATPVINTGKEGVDNGAADFNCCVTTYYSSGTRMSVFSVNTQKSLAFDHAGIRIRLMLGGYSMVNTSTTFNFRLANANLAATTVSATINSNGYGPDRNNTFKGAKLSVAATDIGKWVDWYITNDQLKTSYAEGDSKLVISLENYNGYSAQNVVQANILVDDISYYDMYAPANVVLDETTMNLTWDAVDGATSYVIDVNGVTYDTTEAKKDLSEVLTSLPTAKIKVKAISGEKSSPYSGPISFSIIAKQLAEGQLASFNVKAYESMIASLPKGEQGSTGGNSIKSITYLDATACDGANGGALDIVIKPTSGRNGDFKVTFAEAIDLTNYDGISIRFKVYDKSYYSATDDTSKLYLKLINTTGSQYTGTSNTTSNKQVTEDGWVTITFDATYVAKCLLNGNTQLTFSLYMGGTFTPNGEGTVGLYLDDISYYTAST